MTDAAGWRIVYDSDCGFCRWCLGWILRWDRHRLLTPVALGSQEADALLAPMAEETRNASWHLVDPAGSVTSAGAAAAPLLRLLPGGGPPAALFAALPRPVGAAYRLVASNRTRLGPLVRKRGLERADALIGARSQGRL